MLTVLVATDSLWAKKTSNLPWVVMGAQEQAETTRRRLSRLPDETRILHATVASGSEAIAEYAKERGWHLVMVSPNFTRHGANAWVKRNQELLNMGPTLVIIMADHLGPDLDDLRIQAQGHALVIEHILSDGYAFTQAWQTCSHCGCPSPVISESYAGPERGALRRLLCGGCGTTWTHMPPPNKIPDWDETYRQYADPELDPMAVSTKRLDVFAHEVIEQ